MTHDTPPEPKDGELVNVRPDKSVMTVQRLPYFNGISTKTVGTQGLAMHLVVIPPGAAAASHYHHDFETAIYVLEGRVETRYGLNLEKTLVSEPGDFIFVPPFVPHQPRNLSDTEPARAIIARNDALEHERVTLYPMD